ncbi:conserved hypothetical protein [Acidothermus cellulolyticus 11B]|uniref:Integral membrane protein n=1 Tax=Acidothermus cellulolyticus (strain ATCC 43068 / DSM 8971 / 11B) TaxID=351607 RepID=A0LW57_ACIC1|nr:DUF2269 family protein [Acidothermus cellulolyticus]ABK53667.1 conserved hypothetical protein [Acidothermus cellulolyticus 11B]
MSGTDKILLWFHVATAIFLLGPLTVATSTTPRYIRAGDVAVLRYLNRTTRLFGWGSLLVGVFGAALGRDELSKPWLTASFTLFIVALILLLVVVEPDQRRAINALDNGQSAEVYRGRIVALSASAALIWLIILVLMVWQPGGTH